MLRVTRRQRNAFTPHYSTFCRQLFRESLLNNRQPAGLLDPLVKASRAPSSVLPLGSLLGTDLSKHRDAKLGRTSPLFHPTANNTNIKTTRPIPNQTECTRSVGHPLLIAQMPTHTFFSVSHATAGTERDACLTTSRRRAVACKRPSRSERTKPCTMSKMTQIELPFAWQRSRHQHTRNRNVTVGAFKPLRCLFTLAFRQSLSRSRVRFGRPTELVNLIVHPVPLNDFFGDCYEAGADVLALIEATRRFPVFFESLQECCCPDSMASIKVFRTRRLLAEQCARSRGRSGGFWS